MPESKLRELFCEIGRRVWQRGYIAANDGNFSVRLGTDRFLATPTLVSKGFMHPEDLVVIDGEGGLLEGRRKPTSELRLHLEVYRARADVNAVVHVHPPFATAFAILQAPVPKCVLAEVEVSLGEIPIVPYATPGTAEFAQAIRPLVGDFQAFLLANHGAVTLGRDLEEAYFRMEQVEHYCRILLYSQGLGGRCPIPQDKVAELFELKKRMGFPDRRLQPGGDVSCATPSPAPGCAGIPTPSGSAPAPPPTPAGFDRRRVAEIVRQVLREKGYPTE